MASGNPVLGFVARRLAAVAVVSAFVLLASCSRSGSSQPRGDCSPKNCGGCCDSDGVCRLGITTPACGTAGAACKTCPTGVACNSGVCGPASSGGTGGAAGADAGADRPQGSGTGGAAGTGGATGGATGSGGAAADAAVDTGPPCPTGRDLCSGECVDTTADPRYCGGCGHPCGANQVCAASVCQTPPDCRTTACVGLTYCDLSSGLCKAGCAFDTQCGSNETCDIAAHACVCKTGNHRCSGTCQSDKAITSCGTSCTPCATDPNGTTTCDGTTCALTCRTGYKLCGGVCAACPSANTTATACSGTTCAATACATGYHICSGQCVLSTSTASCGSSCTPCPTSANGTTTCDGTTCGITCATNYRLCGSACAACPTGATTATTCSGSACVASTCSSGYHVCSGMCSSASSTASCGTSCTPCPTTANGTATCNGTSCNITCATNYRLCSSTCSPCPTASVLSTTCSGTQCVPSICSAGYHICSGQCLSQTSLQSCGTSCTPCPASPANGVATCNGTSCGMTCNSGYVACGAACCLDCRSSPSVCTGTDWCQPTTSVCQPAQKVQPDVANTTTQRGFGAAVAVSGLTAVVGSPSDDSTIGAAYVYERQSTGVWTQPLTKLQPVITVPGQGEAFGSAMALSGDRLLVSADLGGPGDAYIFERTGGVWSPIPVVKWTGESDSDLFGGAVALSGDRAIVGAWPALDVSTNSRPGAAYIFERAADGTWPPAGVKLAPVDTASISSFGEAVALSGDHALVYGSTGVYAFARQSDGSWTQEQKLQTPGTAGDLFGLFISMSGNRALIGAEYDGTRGTKAGAAYIYERPTSGGAWALTAKLYAPGPNGGAGDQFGSSVSLEGDRALVGAYAENRVPGTGGTASAGAAYIFRYLPTGAWDAGVEVNSAPSDIIANRSFGAAVSLSWPFVVIGAGGDAAAAPAAGVRSGTAYIINAQSVAQ